MNYPDSELEWWSLFFSIDANKDEPIPEKLTTAEAKAKLRGVFN